MSHTFRSIKPPAYMLLVALPLPLLYATPWLVDEWQHRSALRMQQREHRAAIARVRAFGGSVGLTDTGQVESVTLPAYSMSDADYTRTVITTLKAFPELKHIGGHGYLRKTPGMTQLDVNAVSRAFPDAFVLFNYSGG